MDMTGSRKLAKNGLLSFSCLATAALLTNFLLCVQTPSHPESRFDQNRIAQASLSLFGKHIALPENDYLGNKLPGGKVRIELMLPCPSCLAPGTVLDIDKSRAEMPLILLVRDVASLKQVARDRTDFYCLVELENVLPTSLWSVAPFSLELDAEHIVTSVSASTFLVTRQKVQGS